MYSQSFSSVQKDDALTVRDHWFLYFKGMIYKHKSTEAIMKSQKNFRIKKNDFKTFYNNLWCFSHNCCTITGSLNYFFVFHCFLVQTLLVIK